MAIDTPARLAILGAGPTGLEAALYARFLGYEAVIYERGEVAQSVLDRGHLRMFVPFRACHTTLGLAALQAQDESYTPPAAEELLTYAAWRERYLLPLAATDLLSDHLRLHEAVIAVGKEELLKTDLPGHEDRGDWSFRVLSRKSAGEDRVELFDGVLDSTGIFTTPNWLGHGGIPAIGETSLRDQIEHGWPDILGRDRPRYAGKHTLLIGGGLSAASNVVALAELAAAEPQTKVSWITRREGAAGASGPVPIRQDDPWPARVELIRRANAAVAAPGAVTCWPQTVVERIGPAPGGQFEVALSGQHPGTIRVDAIIANVGFRPDDQLLAELQVEQHFAWQMPPRLAAVLAEQLPASPAALLHPEPHVYVLGRKSYGRRSDYEPRIAYEQIRQVFTLIGDRADLDLYQSATRLLR